MKQKYWVDLQSPDTVQLDWLRDLVVFVWPLGLEVQAEDNVVALPALGVVVVQEWTSHWTVSRLFSHPLVLVVALVD